MSDRIATGTKQDTDRIVLSVPEAAQRLGVTPDAIRARLHRGTLAGEKQDGEWKVFLPGEAVSPIGDTPPIENEKSDRSVRQDATGKQSEPTGARQDADRQSAAALIAAKDETITSQREEIAFLRDQLDKRSRELADERERSDVLHREAFARIEALTAGLTTMVDTESADEPDNDQAPSSRQSEGHGDPDHLERVRAYVAETSKTPQSPQSAQDASGAMTAFDPKDEVE